MPKALKAFDLPQTNGRKDRFGLRTLKREQSILVGMILDLDLEAPALGLL